MKLAEALVSRADTQKRLEQLRERLRLSAVVQEGEQPPEDTQELLAEVARLIADLTALIPRINSANLSTTLPDGTTLTAALARRALSLPRVEPFPTVRVGQGHSRFVAVAGATRITLVDVSPCLGPA